MAVPLGIIALFTIPTTFQVFQISAAHQLFANILFCQLLVSYAFQKYILYNFFIGLVPDVPINLAVTNLTPRSAKISWERDRDYLFPNPFSTYWIRLKKNNSLILNTTTTRKRYEITNLTPNTRYEISVAAQNRYGLGQDTFTSFLTPEDGE